MGINNDREYLNALERAESNAKKFATFVSELEKSKSGDIVPLEKAYSQLREDISDIEEYQKSFSSDEWYDGFQMDPSEVHRGVPALEEEVLATLTEIDDAGCREYTQTLLAKAKEGALPSTVKLTRCICNEFTVCDRNGNRIGSKIYFPREAAVTLSKLRYLLIVINTLSESKFTASVNSDSDNNDIVVYYKG